MALTDNLISVWELTEASGNALDSYGSNTLTDNNTVGAASGKIIGSRDFERDNGEYFSKADNASLSCGDIDFTIAAWFKSESNNSQVIVSKSTAEYQLYMASSVIRWNIKDVIELSSGVTISTGTWYHIFAWHDSVNNLIGTSVNGAAAVTTSYSGGCTDGTNDFGIGAISSGIGFNCWDGCIEQVAFWKRVVDSTDRATIYNSGAGLAYSSWAGGGGGTVIPVFMNQYRQRWAA